jgi:myo-inositol 2-dehydrogenase/D-chiro-inositol 1-dehydrogenase
MLKIGIIGAGRIGKVHAESITKYVKSAEVKAIADPFINEQTKAWALEMGIKEVYKDYHEILNDKEIDAVLICSSTDTHSKISLEAIAANKHIFCEKPIDHDVERIREVVAALENSNVKYQVGFNRRFDHNFKAVKQAVVDGKIGVPHILKITSRDPEPPSIEYVKVSGGMFLDMTIHDFDMVRFLLDTEVEEVFAYGASLVNSEIGKAGDIDTAIITLKLQNGALAVIDNSRQAAYGYDQRAEVFGSLGQVAVSNDSTSTAVISNGNGVNSEKPLFFFLERYMQAYAEEISSFVDAIVNDKAVTVTAVDGLKPVLIGLAAKKSLQENRPVKLSEMEN